MAFPYPPNLFKPMTCTLSATLFPIFLQSIYEDLYQVQVDLPGWVHFGFVAAFFLLAWQAFGIVFKEQPDG